MRLETIKAIIGDASDDEVIRAWGAFCENTDRYDDVVYDNDNDTYQMLFGDNIDEALRAASYGDFNYTDSYVVINGYGNLDTFSYLCSSKCPVDKDELADYFYENQDEFYIWFDFNPDDYEGYEDDEEDDDDDDCYIACPECGTRLEQGEYEYDYDSGHTRVVNCPECGCSGDVVKFVDPTDDDDDDEDENEN